MKRPGVSALGLFVFVRSILLPSPLFDSRAGEGAEGGVTGIRV
jgi:hypothetical protein